MNNSIIYSRFDAIIYLFFKLTKMKERRKKGIEEEEISMQANY